MSAYIVSPETITRIAIAANTNHRGITDANAAQRDAVVLLNESILSVIARYPDIEKRDAVSTFISDLTTISYIDETDRGIKVVTSGSTFNPKSTDWLKFVWRDISEYIYQSCEHDDWEGSKGQQHVALNAAYWISCQLLEDAA